MSLVLEIFVNNVLPAFVVIAAGVLADRTLHVDKKHLSRLAIYVLTPCLVFTLISNSTVDPREFAQIIVYAIVMTVAMCVLALGVGRLLRWPGPNVDGLVLSTAFFNAGNFGLSVVLFTFGEAGLEFASVFFVASSFATHTLATYFANRSHRGDAKALLKVFALPAPYAFVLALILRALGWAMPQVIEKPVSLIAQAAVPILLMMLGLQLSRTRIRKRFRDISVGVVLRLILGAVAAVAIAPVIGLQGLARQVAIVEASTPTAVSSALLAIEADADAEFVASVILVSTLLSSVTLTLLISLLRA